MVRSSFPNASLGRDDDRGDVPWGTVAGLVAALAYSVWPGLTHLADTPVPGWVRFVLGIAILQAAFLIWMLLVRHWAAMVVVTLSFALASTTYALFTYFAFTMVSDRLDVTGSAARAAVWSATVVAVHLVATYASGIAAVNWRRREAGDRFHFE